MNIYVHEHLCRAHIYAHAYAHVHARVHAHAYARVHTHVHAYADGRGEHTGRILHACTPVALLPCCPAALRLLDARQLASGKD